MKKIIIGIILLLVIGVVVLFLNLNSAAKGAIERAGSQALGVPVHVGGLNISLANKSSDMNGLSVSNPAGFKAANILQADKISVTLGEVTQKVITIQNITIDGMVVAYELGTKGTNFDAIKNNIKRASTPGAQAAADQNADAKSSSGDAPEVIIRNLQIVNAKLIPVIGGQQAAIPLPDITMNNIGSKTSPATASQVAMQVMNRIMTTSSVAMIESGMNDGVKKISEGLKSLF